MSLLKEIRRAKFNIFYISQLSDCASCAVSELYVEIGNTFPLLGGKYRFGISIPATPLVEKRGQGEGFARRENNVSSLYRGRTKVGAIPKGGLS